MANIIVLAHFKDKDDIARAIIAQKVRLPAWLVQLTSENQEVNCKFIDVAVPEKIYVKGIYKR